MAVAVTVKLTLARVVVVVVVAMDRGRRCGGEDLAQGNETVEVHSWHKDDAAEDALRHDTRPPLAQHLGDITVQQYAVSRRYVSTKYAGSRRHYSTKCSEGRICQNTIRSE